MTKTVVANDSHERRIFLHGPIPHHTFIRQLTHPAQRRNTLELNGVKNYLQLDKLGTQGRHYHSKPCFVLLLFSQMNLLLCAFWLCYFACKVGEGHVVHCKVVHWGPGHLYLSHFISMADESSAFNT